MASRNARSTADGESSGNLDFLAEPSAQARLEASSAAGEGAGLPPVSSTVARGIARGTEKGSVDTPPVGRSKEVPIASSEGPSPSALKCDGKVAQVFTEAELIRRSWSPESSLLPHKRRWTPQHVTHSHMTSLFQRLEPENQDQRARDQALKCIDDIPPVIINGEDITRDARNLVKGQVKDLRRFTLVSLRPRRGQSLGGLFAFFVEISKAKQRHKARIKEFKVVSTAFVAYVLRNFPRKGATELLASQASRLSNDAKRVTNQIYKKSTEISERSSSHPAQSQQTVHYNLHRRIWEKDDMEEFEKNQDQQAQVNHLADTETATIASPRGLPPPPRLARKYDKYEAIIVDKDLLLSSEVQALSSGYEASSSDGSSRHSHQGTESLD
ncbi:hypothetical protein E4T56_gene20168 [Termitomyces sp. T112]|nr:hypothetical protein E4T56_gene20168 [Termitomyces sp. T112]